MSSIVIEQMPHVPMSRREMELVERKGVGHPDSICDATMEAASVALSKVYLETTGQILHHNLDKALLVAGQTTPRLGGGSVDAPMRLVVGDRATTHYQGVKIPVQEVMISATRHWFRSHLRHVDPDLHLIVQNELKPGSAELASIFTRSATAGGVGSGAVSSAGAAHPPAREYVANDTSAAVGFAPLTETERLVLATEHFLNSSEFKQRFPETGEDIKVMGIRRGRELNLTVAIAFVDHYFWESATYFHRKTAVQMELQQFLATKIHALDRLQISMNTLDDPARGMEGMYLTVLGTSAESADGGEVGRGNRVNGLISLSRPMTMEAAAGKNPVSHVGKIYNLLAHRMADSIYAGIDGVEEVYVWLCSQIGGRLDTPYSASAQLALSPGVAISDVERTVSDIIHRELADVGHFTERLARGEFHVC